MTLRDIKAYLMRHQRATLTDLSHHFSTEPTTLEPMLAHWERKGKVRHTHLEACNQGCTCSKGTLDIYEWVESPSPRVIPLVPQS